MARQSNAVTFGAGFNISGVFPIDSRMRVDTENDLVLATTWPADSAPVFDGMFVVVKDTGDIWTLKNKAYYTDKTTGKGWCKVGGSVIDDDNITEITTYSSKKITELITGLGFSIEVLENVGDLPVSGDSRTLYLVPNVESGVTNYYIEYIYIDENWEVIGTTNIDLTDYYTKEEVDNLLDDKQNTLTEGTNIEIDNTTINAIGYFYDKDKNSFSEGVRSGVIYLAHGNNSHVEGHNNLAIGDSSHVEGSGDLDTVLGEWSCQECSWEIYETDGTTDGLYDVSVDSIIVIYDDNNKPFFRRITSINYEHKYIKVDGEIPFELLDDKLGIILQGCAYGNYSHAENISTAIGKRSHSEGQYSESIGETSHAEGYYTRAMGEGSHVEGNTNITFGNFSHAEGKYYRHPDYGHSHGTSSIGEGSHAEGIGGIAVGEGSHAEGIRSLAMGDYSHAEGGGNNYTVVVNDGDTGLYLLGSGVTYRVVDNADDFNYSRYLIVGNYYTIKDSNVIAKVIEINGDINTGYVIFDKSFGNISSSQFRSNGQLFHLDVGAFGNYSHSEGYNTLASGENSHAEGEEVTASGKTSHAEGYRTVVNGFYSHAEGANTITQNESEHAEGKSNVSHKASDIYGDAGNTQHSIGIGGGDVSFRRRNAFEIMQNGDAYLYGAGNYNGENIDKATRLQDLIGGQQNLVPITYLDLKELRDNEKLSPGTQYRIIDYVTTVQEKGNNNENGVIYKPAGHQFDIIVVADSNKSLNENARAVQHDAKIWHKWRLPNTAAGDMQYVLTEQRIYTNTPTGTIDGGEYYTTTYDFNGFLNVDSESMVEYYGWNNKHKKIIATNGNSLLIGDNLITSSEQIYEGKWFIDAGNTATYDGTIIDVTGTSSTNGENYFDGVNLSAWDIKYSLDNDKSRFEWVIAHEQDAIQIDLGDGSYTFIRYPQEDKDGKYAWVGIDGDDGNMDFAEITNWITIHEGEISYTTVEKPVPYVDTATNPYAEDEECEIWGFEEGGKGVIYHMKDEWNNECPYDFKNILYKYDNVFVYTFNWEYSDEDGRCIDASIFGNNGTLVNEEDSEILVYNNTMKEYYRETEYIGLPTPMLTLNKNLFLSDQAEYGGNIFLGFHDNHFGYNTYSNRIKQGCYFNSFDNNSNSNYLSKDCHKNIFGFEASNNHLSAECYKNIFENGSSSNSLSAKCTNNHFNISSSNILNDECGLNVFNRSNNNTLGKKCDNNNFYNQSTYNQLDEGSNGNFFIDNSNHNQLSKLCTANIFYCSSYNILEYLCRYNWFLYNSSYNELRSLCEYNTFKRMCQHNVLWNNNHYIIFENNSNYNQIKNGYIKNVVFGRNTKYCLIQGYSTGSSYSLGNVNVLPGTHGEKGNLLQLTGLTVGADYEQMCGFNSNGVYTVKNPLD